MRRAIAVFCLFLAASSLPAMARAEEKAPNETMFARLSELVGDWTGTLEWTGARTGKGDLTASYYLTGMGSALVENLVMNGTPSMTTVYHLDGTDLRMTHYCGAHNQPRLKAARMDPDAGQVDFAFVDVTNAKSTGYVHAFELRMPAPGELHLKFTFGEGEKQAFEDITLHRAPAKS